MQFHLKCVDCLDPPEPVTKPERILLSWEVLGHHCKVVFLLDQQLCLLQSPLHLFSCSEANSLVNIPLNFESMSENVSY